MNKKIIILIVFVGTIAASFYLGTQMVDSSNVNNKSEEGDASKPLFYRNPMNPEVTSPVPAQDSMGMDYIPVYADSSAESKSPVGTVKIDPTFVQNIGVRTAVAQQKSFGRTIRTVGRIEFDEEKMINLHTKVEGWIEEIYIDKTGQKVEEDAILLNIYSPMLVTAQQEYLLALNNLNTLSASPFNDVKRGAEQLVESSRERLNLLDVPEHQIKELEFSRAVKKNLHIHSPFSGTVVQIGAREGQYVTPKTELYMIVDLSKIWVYADIYEYEIPWVKIGDRVAMTLTSVPGKSFTGEVAYIYPYAEPKTRTTKVRIVFDNKDHHLRPNMFADVSIKAQAKENMIVIPSEAVIRSGKQEQVFIVRGPGKYEPRIVKLGIESNGEVAVLSGINPGDQVVTSSQFLVDSESKLREAAAKMTKSSSEKNADDHSTMDHSQMKDPKPKEGSQSKNTDERIDHSKMNHDSMESDMSNQNNAEDNKMMDNTPNDGAHLHD